MAHRAFSAVLVLAAALWLLAPAEAGEATVKDRILEDVKTHRIHSTRGQTPEADRPVIRGRHAEDPETGETLAVHILKAEPIPGSLKYAAFYHPGRNVYWTFVWGGPRNVRIIHGPFELKDVTLDMVEKALRKLITPEGNYGFYKDQFKELVALGKEVVPFLLDIFRDESRDMSMRVLALEALGDMKDDSVVPTLREYLQKPDYRDFMESIIFTLAKLGDRTFADRMIQSYLQAIETNRGNPRVQAQGYAGLAHAYARLENQEKAIEAYKKAIELDPESASIHYYNMACGLAVMNEIDKAIEALERAVEHGYDDYDWMRMDGDLKNLHGDPRFERLLERLKKK